MKAVADRPSVIVFDWDNTLVDTWPTIHDALNATLEAMGHDIWSLDETKRRVRRSLRDSFPVLFGERWTEARDIFYSAFERSHIERLTPIPGAADLLAGLSRSGIRMAVLSNKTGRYLREEAKHLGWDAFFVEMVGAGDAGRDKPDSEALEKALTKLGCRAGPAVWIVGDAGIDMEIAHRTGCVPVLLHRADHDAEEFANWPPKFTFSSCNSLKELLAK